MHDWVTALWSLLAGLYLALGVVHFLVWIWDRRRRANMWFSITSLSVGGLALLELASMFSTSIEGFLQVHRWGHVVVWCMLVSLILFVCE